MKVSKAVFVPIVAVVQERMFIPPQLGLGNCSQLIHGWGKQPLKLGSPGVWDADPGSAATLPDLCGFSLDLLCVFSNYFSFYKVFLPCLLLSPDLLHVACVTLQQHRILSLPAPLKGAWMH